MLTIDAWWTCYLKNIVVLNVRDKMNAFVALTNGIEQLVHVLNILNLLCRRSHRIQSAARQGGYPCGVPPDTKPEHLRGEGRVRISKACDHPAIVRQSPEFRTVVAHSPKPRDNRLTSRDGIPTAIFNDLKKVGDAVDVMHQESFPPAGWDLDWFFALLNGATTGTEPSRTLGDRFCNSSGRRSSPPLRDAVGMAQSSKEVAFTWADREFPVRFCVLQLMTPVKVCFKVLRGDAKCSNFKGTSEGERM